MTKSPSLARGFYKNFNIISWIFTIAFFASMIYSAYGIYNLVLFGSCEPGSSCIIAQAIYEITCYEKQFVIVVITILVAFLLYFGYKYIKHEE